MTLIYMCHSMIVCLDPNISPSSWREAANIDNCIRNRIIEKRRFERKNTHETSLVVKPDLYHLKIFGPVAYVHLSKGRKIRKFSKRAEEGAFLG